MIKEKAIASQNQTAKPELQALYRPLGLKAVAAAAMMLKRPPVKKPV